MIGKTMFPNNRSYSSLCYVAYCVNLFNYSIPVGYKPSTKSVGRTASNIRTRKESHRTRRRTTTKTVREVSRRRGQTGGQSSLVSKGSQTIF